VKEHPILFSGPMVRALLDSSKTQTRRIVKSQPPADVSPILVSRYHPTVIDRRGDEQPGEEIFGAHSDDGEWGCKCPFGQPGDRLWVRETFLYVGPGSGSDLPSYREERANPENHMAANCWFRASRPDETLVWTPSIHMPRWASRITLEITGVRVERLQDISEADAEAEGVDFLRRVPDADETLSARDLFWCLWDSLAAPASDWAANPWVWVVDFKRVT
jgi:hypothetical protein